MTSMRSMRTLCALFLSLACTASFPPVAMADAGRDIDSSVQEYAQTIMQRYNRT